MFCNKCGNKIENEARFCNKCGNPINYDRESKSKTKINRKSIPLLALIVGIIIILILCFVIYKLFFSSEINYYFDNENVIDQNQQASTQDKANNNSNKDNSITTSNKKKKYKTDIITDNIYSGLTINSVGDAKKIIIDDSVKQKQVDYPKEIIQIEDSIIQNYGITAVNLKEVDVELAKELENVIKMIYAEYPKAREHLTNLSLTNLTMSNASTIALFMPIFQFGSSNTATTRPWIIKTQVQLNAKYFLNMDKLKASVEASSKIGHFPNNATIYSPVAHELGHYLSFIALLNHYSADSILIIDDNNMQKFYDLYDDFDKGNFSKQILDEAYKNYLKDTNTSIEFDEWRAQISEYAISKDNTGRYIYDETIAESFHDVYLNKQNSSTTSKYIVEVLKKYIGV